MMARLMTMQMNIMMATLTATMMAMLMPMMIAQHTQWAGVSGKEFPLRWHQVVSGGLRWPQGGGSDRKGHMQALRGPRRGTDCC